MASSQPAGTGIDGGCHVNRQGILNYENEVEYWHSGVTYWGLEGGYSYNENNLLQCRIAFFNLDYPDEPNKNSNGYMYNTKKDQIQIFWDTGRNKEDYG